MGQKFSQKQKQEFLLNQITPTAFRDLVNRGEYPLDAFQARIGVINFDKESLEDNNYGPLSNLHFHRVISEQELEDLFPDNNGTKILVRGEPGIGKTTLIHYMCHVWSKTILWNSKFDHVWKIELKDFVDWLKDFSSEGYLTMQNDRKIVPKIFKNAAEKYASLIYFIEKTRNPDGLGPKFTKEDVLKRIMRKQELFILDGYDANSLELVDFSTLKGLPEVDTWKEAKELIETFPNVIVVSHLDRPFKEKIHFDKLVVNQGRFIIKNKHIIDPWDKKFSKDQIGRMIDGHSLIAEFCRIPFNFDLFMLTTRLFPGELLKLGEENKLDVTHFYHTITIVLQANYEHHNRPVTATESGFLTKLAFCSYAKNQIQVVHRTLLDDLLTEVHGTDQEKKFLLLSALRTYGIIQPLNRTWRGDHFQDYYFVDKTFHEYYVAKYLIDNWGKDKKEIMKFISDHAPNPKCAQIFQFYQHLLPILLKDKASILQDISLALIHVPSLASTEFILNMFRRDGFTPEQAISIFEKYPSLTISILEMLTKQLANMAQYKYEGYLMWKNEFENAIARNSKLVEVKLLERFIWSFICEHIKKDAALVSKTVNIAMKNGLEEMIPFLQQSSEVILHRMIDFLYVKPVREPEIGSASVNDIHFTFNFHGTEKVFIGLVFETYSANITKPNELKDIRIPPESNDSAIDYDSIIKDFIASNQTFFSVPIEPPTAPVVFKLTLIIPITAILPGSKEKVRGADQEEEDSLPILEAITELWKQSITDGASELRQYYASLFQQIDQQSLTKKDFQEILLPMLLGMGLTAFHYIILHKLFITNHREGNETEDWFPEETSWKIFEKLIVEDEKDTEERHSDANYRLACQLLYFYPQFVKTENGTKLMMKMLKYCGSYSKIGVQLCYIAFLNQMKPFEYSASQSIIHHEKYNSRLIPSLFEVIEDSGSSIVQIGVTQAMLYKLLQFLLFECADFAYGVEYPADIYVLSMVLLSLLDPDIPFGGSESAAIAGPHLQRVFGREMNISRAVFNYYDETIKFLSPVVDPKDMNAIDAYTLKKSKERSDSISSIGSSILGSVLSINEITYKEREEGENESLLEFNRKYSTEVFAKISGKETYKMKFVWIDARKKTLCMSTSHEKYKKHREVGVKQLVECTIGFPKKYNADSIKEQLHKKRQLTKSGGAGTETKEESSPSAGVVQELDGMCFMSLKFVGNWGIDLVFLDKLDALRWFLYLEDLKAGRAQLPKSNADAQEGDTGRADGEDEEEDAPSAERTQAVSRFLSMGAIDPLFFQSDKPLVLDPNADFLGELVYLMGFFCKLQSTLENDEVSVSDFKYWLTDNSEDMQSLLKQFDLFSFLPILKKHFFSKINKNETMKVDAMTVLDLKMKELALSLLTMSPSFERYCAFGHINFRFYEEMHRLYPTEFNAVTGNNQDYGKLMSDMITSQTYRRLNYSYYYENIFTEVLKIRLPEWIESAIKDNFYHSVYAKENELYNAKTFSSLLDIGLKLFQPDRYNLSQASCDKLCSCFLLEIQSPYLRVPFATLKFFAFHKYFSFLGELKKRFPEPFQNYEEFQLSVQKELLSTRGNVVPNYSTARTPATTSVEDQQLPQAKIHFYFPKLLKFLSLRYGDNNYLSRQEKDRWIVTFFDDFLTMEDCLTTFPFVGMISILQFSKKFIQENNLIPSELAMKKPATSGKGTTSLGKNTSNGSDQSDEEIMNSFLVKFPILEVCLMNKILPSILEDLLKYANPNNRKNESNLKTKEEKIVGLLLYPNYDEGYCTSLIRNHGSMEVQDIEWVEEFFYPLFESKVNESNRFRMIKDAFAEKKALLLLEKQK